MKRFVYLLSVVLFSSCTNAFYHVSSVQSEQVKLVNKDFVFENEHLKVVYNLWERGGRMRFLVFNKTNQPMYIDWSKSFLVRNDTKIVYGQLPPLTKDAPIDTVRYTYQDVLVEPYRITSRGSRLAEIPSQTLVAVADIPIQQTVLNRQTQEKLIAYTRESSPLRLTHQLAYSFDSTLTNSHFVEQAFWVDKIQVVREGALIKAYGSLKKGQPNALYAVEHRVATVRVITITVVTSIALYFFIRDNLFNNFSPGF